jgi:threonine/homoserine/homoserine lactone efflux protein
MFEYLISGFLLGGAAAVQPGPFQAYLAGRTLKYGWRKTLSAAFAPLLSDGPIIILVVFILSQTPVLFLDVLYSAGGVFLLYLAFSAYKEARRAGGEGTEDDNTAESAISGGMLKAVLMNILNPHPYIFWAAIAGPMFLRGWREASQLGAAFMIGFYGTLTGGFVLFIGMIHAVGRMGKKAHYWLGLASSVILFGFGGYMLLQGITALISA